MFFPMNNPYATDFHKVHLSLDDYVKVHKYPINSWIWDTKSQNLVMYDPLTLSKVTLANEVYSLCPSQ